MWVWVGNFKCAELRRGKEFGMKSEQKIMWTEDYDQFNLISTNRSVKDQRKAKLMSSIREVGFITNPIIVNEKYSVIDGQGRLSALKELGLPVPYIIVDGIGHKECMALNQYNSKWSIMDFMESWAHSGNENYVRLLKLINAYPGIGMRNIMFAVSLTESGDTGGVKRGEFICTSEQYIDAVRRLEYCNQFVEISKEINGSRAYFINAIIFAFEDEAVDNDRLAKQVLTRWSTMKAISREKDAFEAVSDIYNYHNHGDKLYLWVDYERQTGPKRKYVKDPAQKALRQQAHIG